MLSSRGIGNKNPRLTLRELATGRALRNLEGVELIDDSFLDVAEFSPDGKSVLTACASNRERTNHIIRLFDVGTGREIRQLGEQNNLAKIGGFSADGSLALTFGFFGDRACVWDVATGKQVQVIKNSADPHTEYAALLSLDGKSVLTLGGSGRRLSLWDVQTGRCLREFEASDRRIWSCGWSAWHLPGRQIGS